MSQTTLKSLQARALLGANLLRSLVIVSYFYYKWRLIQDNVHVVVAFRSCHFKRNRQSVLTQYEPYACTSDL